MEFDVAKVNALIIQEKWADYWRERAECLAEWVCDLLGKPGTSDCFTEGTTTEPAA